MPFHGVLSIDYAIRCRQVIIRFYSQAMHRIDGRNAYAKKNYERVIMKLTTIPLSLKDSIAFSLYEMVECFGIMKPWLL